MGFFNYIIANIERNEKQMAKKETNNNKKTKIKKPLDKRKLIQNIIIIVLVVAMLLSVAGTLIMVSIYGKGAAEQMIRSMTGFGRWETVTEEYRISVEMKAVNHRYLDMGIKMPRKFNLFEAAVRNLLKHYIQRGKVDVYIAYEDYTEEKLCLKYNSSLASEYMDYIQ